MLKVANSPRILWRNTQIIARQMDRLMPQWWVDQEALKTLYSSKNSVAIRCWQQLIRQRMGW